MKPRPKNKAKDQTNYGAEATMFEAQVKARHIRQQLIVCEHQDLDNVI